MKVDISRDSFQPDRFTRLLIQQGRLQLDADLNELSDILLHTLRQTSIDAFGRFWGPARQAGFKIEPKGTPGTNWAEYTIGTGRYYVDGIAVEAGLRNGEANDPWPLQQQRFVDLNVLTNPIKDDVLLYLEVWERQIVGAQDEGIDEVALQGIDTAARVEVVWAVGAEDTPKFAAITKPDDEIPADIWDEWVAARTSQVAPAMAARVTPPPAVSDRPCAIPPTAGYRGSENQLYRVEIHTVDPAAKAFTFKWSRDNGSVVFPLEPQRETATTLLLRDLGRDRRYTLEEGDWVEYEDDDYARKENQRVLYQVASIDPPERRVELRGTPAVMVGSREKHPLLRRWDMREIPAPTGKKGAKAVPFNGIAAPATGTDNLNDAEASAAWADLESGIQVIFREGATYRPGDFWLIPARTVGDVLGYTGPDGKLQFKERQGIIRHYAPLALLKKGANAPIDLRRLLKPNLQVPA
jgi:hypothetical protein